MFSSASYNILELQCIFGQSKRTSFSEYLLLKQNDLAEEAYFQLKVREIFFFIQRSIQQSRQETILQK